MEVDWGKVVRIILTVLCIIVFSWVIFGGLVGCTVVTDEDNEVVNTTRPMFIVCLFSACEHEVQDGHSTGELEEGAQDVSPDISVPVSSVGDGVNKVIESLGGSSE